MVSRPPNQQIVVRYKVWVGPVADWKRSEWEPMGVSSGDGKGAGGIPPAPASNQSLGDKYPQSCTWAGMGKPPSRQLSATGLLTDPTHLRSWAAE